MSCATSRVRQRCATFLEVVLVSDIPAGWIARSFDTLRREIDVAAETAGRRSVC